LSAFYSIPRTFLPVGRRWPVHRVRLGESGGCDKLRETKGIPIYISASVRLRFVGVPFGACAGWKCSLKWPAVTRVYDALGTSGRPLVRRGRGSPPDKPKSDWKLRGLSELCRGRQALHRRATGPRSFFRVASLTARPGHPTARIGAMASWVGTPNRSSLPIARRRNFESQRL
jgi:hypothetical protein